jgi:hypothetical protein
LLGRMGRPRRLAAHRAERGFSLYEVGTAGAARCKSVSPPPDSCRRREDATGAARPSGVSRGHGKARRFAATCGRRRRARVSRGHVSDRWSQRAGATAPRVPTVTRGHPRGGSAPREGRHGQPPAPRGGRRAPVGREPGGHGTASARPGGMGVSRPRCGGGASYAATPGPPPGTCGCPSRLPGPGTGRQPRLARADHGGALRSQHRRAQVQPKRSLTRSSASP